VRCNDVRVFEEEGDCSLCLEMSDDELMRHLISGELTNYRVVCTRPKPLHMRFRLESLMEEFKRGTAIREEFKGGTALGVKYMKRMKLSQHNSPSKS
jgi:hypothetical protein